MKTNLQKLLPSVVRPGDIDPAEDNLIAAVDLGSESFHMVVGREEHGQIVIIDKLKESVRLASGLDVKNVLDNDSQDRALECLARFGQRLRGLSEQRVRAVGTSALRRAQNSRSFKRLAEGVLGHRIQIINGREEARLVYVGVARSMAFDNSNRLVIDIGGGSTELIIGKAARALKRESLELGCVTMTEDYFGDGKITRKRMKRAELAARLAVEPIEKVYQDTGWQSVIGCSGTMRAAAAVAKMNRFVEDGLTRDAIDQMREAVLESGHVRELPTRLDFGSLGDRRMAIFPGGLACIAGIFDELGIEKVSLSDKALREGLLFDLQGRLRHEDTRGSSVAAMCSRYGVDLNHGERVRSTALAFFDQTHTAWDLGDPLFRDLLAWASALHELGLAVSHSKYHWHGEYLILQSDLAGFSNEEQAALAALVRNHRRSFNEAAFSVLTDELAEASRRLTCLLRLAVLIHRGRTDGMISGIAVSASKRKISLDFPTGWLEAHPLTKADLGQERLFLAESGIKLRVTSRN